ncbi:MAG TPA: ABC transporter permease subunit [Candidatus Limnocylindrales bacterium]|nr:ABC transporter permease subunit [Candidatus Limnocylindrales bacterium]
MSSARPRRLPLAVRAAWLRRRPPLAVLAAFLPFAVFCALFELLPVAVLVQGSLGGLDTPTLDYLGRVFAHPVYRRAVLNSVIVAGLSSVIGALFGTAIGYAILTTRRRGVAEALTALANIASNAGGISLAFAFITVLGSTGALTIALRQLGIELYEAFSLYSLAGLVLVYAYFQVPLMVILMLPAFAGVRREWHEASYSLGGTAADFWRRVGIPILLPSIAAGTVLMFANGLGAYATAVALMGGQANLMTVQVAVLRQGEVVFQPAQADAMATVLLGFVALTVGLYHAVQRRTQRWVR